MNQEIAKLIERQEAVSAEWRDKLKGIQQRQFTYTSPLGNVLHYTLQCNTERIRSTMAKTGAVAAPVKCRICADNRPSDQLFFVWKAEQSGNAFDILINPFPIFPAHLTVVSTVHRPQTIDARDMQEFAYYSRLAVFFNGADCGASIPAHMHYQAAPIECFNLIEDADGLDTKPITEKAGWLVGMERDVIFMETRENDDAQAELLSILDVLDRDTDRMINVVVYYNESSSSFHWFIFPRKKFRPECFFAEDEAQRRLVSPATAEMCGVIVTPDINTFENITCEEIHNIIYNS
ncbi:MAG: DUF4922 domain-containing protein [Bacteroidia bacterium]|nr:DUF4922 domain-containing protein [Bacteroidia bacterium]